MEPKELLRPSIFFFELPLYTKITVEDDILNNFKVLLCYGENDWDIVDGYNPLKQLNTTFSGTGNGSQNDHSTQHLLAWGGIREISLRCKRYEDILSFTIYYDAKSKEVQKIGQYPSLADFHISHIKQYNKLLSNEKLKEFTRGIGLYANGVGIGAFVYLRRIFESLVDEARGDAIKDGVINAEDFKKALMDKKIEMLSDYLPEFLVENKSIYSILSSGIHQLDEQTCLTHFETIKAGIEIILDERLEQQKKKKKMADAKKKISEVVKSTKISAKKK